MKLWVNWKLFLINYLLLQGLNLDIMNLYSYEKIFIHYNIHNLSFSCFISNEQGLVNSFMTEASVI